MEKEDEEGLVAYVISATDTEIVLKIEAGDSGVTVHMRVNQAFAFIVLFISTLAKLVSPLSPEGALGLFIPKKGGDDGGESPLSGGASMH